MRALDDSERRRSFYENLKDTFPESCFVLMGQAECSLRSKRFQSSYCAKVRAEAKKRLKGEGEGRRGNACPQTPRFWKTPLDISRFGSFVN